MTTPKFRVYIAVTVDGYIADREGCVDWLNRFSAEDYGYEAFLETIDMVVMGRKSFDQVLGFGNWPYGGKQSVVLTNRDAPERNMPEQERSGVRFAAGDVEKIAGDLAGEAKGDIWIMGGADVIRQFLNAGRVDTLEMYVMPVLLGGGVRMFPETGTPTGLSLSSEESYRSGAVKLLYSVR